MSKQKERIAYLLEVYTSKKATSQDELELMEWLHEAKEDSELKLFIQSLWDQHKTQTEISHVNWDRMFETVINSDKVISIVSEEKRTRFLWTRIAAAACIVLLLGVGTYFLFFNKPGKQIETAKSSTDLPNDVKAPQSNRAMITLANGERIYLDSVKNGQLVKEGNVKLVKLSNGQIIYETEKDEAVTEMSYNTLNNPKGSQVIDMTLADGSRVWLNAGSSITYPVSFIGNERKVSITGEAYFEVSHDASKPFYVTKDAMQVQVLGTKFNVNAYNDEADIKVTLLEGSVSVRQSQDEKSVIIKRGEQAQIANSIKVEDDIDVDEVMAWKNGRFVFGEKADIQTIMRQIARWYDVDVEYRGTVTKHFGGSISRQVNVSGVFKVLEATGGVKCKVEGRKVIVFPAS